ncbi:hypothetical protein [Chromobacterium subtsugae]|uniref:hypothetical protein n=1 Tax=Chromobacterium subtsugae TaxID=251747 RepID=UPI0009B9A9DB|nr:hypothetical protein [Chromobacterium subtsugae]
MDNLTFTSEAIKSLTWPLTVIVIVRMLRKPITELLPFIKKLKYKEFEMEFAKEVAELKAEAKVLELSSAKEVTEEKITENRLLQLVQFSSRAAIMEAWIEVETAATEVASSFWNEPPSDTFRNHSKIGEYLLQCKVIDKKQLEIFNKLKHLRNKAAHAEELNVSENDVRSYIELAANLAAHIRTT